MRAHELGLGCALALSASLWACGGGGGKPRLEVSSAERELEVSVGREGAVLELEERARVTIPPDALEERTMIRLRREELDRLPTRPGAAYTELEQAVVIEPHDLALRRPATVEVVVRDDAVPRDDLRVLRLSNEQDRSYEELERRVNPADRRTEALSEFELRRAEGSGDSITTRRRVQVEVETFSFFVAVRLAVPPSLTGSCVDMPAGTVCRPAVDVCDEPERCDGESPTCPRDLPKPASELCRPAVDACDVDEFCDGQDTACPLNQYADVGTACDDGLFCTATDLCDGRGLCEGSGDPCLAEADDNDGDCAENCDEEADACSAANPDGVACRTQPCEEGACAGGECQVDLECPVFVDSRGTGDAAGCGTGWNAAACATVQGGANEAARTDNPRVFVRAESFVASGATPVLTMSENTEYYGGFAGSEDLLSERPADSFTRLDGNGQSPHVVVGASNTRLDGFEVTRGVGGPTADSSALAGAGMFNDGSVSRLNGIVVANSIFQGNAIPLPPPRTPGSPAYGGGIYNAFVQGLLLESVELRNNSVDRQEGAFGGGMASRESTVTLNDVQFTGNSVGSGGLSTTSTGGHRGGGLYDENTDSTLNDALFDGNIAEGVGGARPRGGAYAIVGAGFSTRLDGVTVRNHLDGDVDQGAGLFISGSNGSETVTIADSVFENNKVGRGPAPQGGGVYAEQVQQLDISGSSFVDNGAEGPDNAQGGGLYTSVVTSLNDTQFYANVAADVGGSSGGIAEGGGVYATAALAVEDSDFLDNTASADGSAAGAGVDFASAGGLTMRNVSFASNQATSSGPGASGAAGGGAFINAAGGNFTLAHVTFLENAALVGSSELAGAALRLAGGSGFADNVAVYGSSSAAEIREDRTAITTWGPLCAPAGELVNGGSYITVTASDFIEAPSKHPFLTETSACVDAGDDAVANSTYGAAVWPTLTTRIDGTPDATRADLGRHYTPSGPWIRSFTATPSAFDWEVVAPAGTTCLLEGSEFSYDVPEADIASGMVAHTLSSGTELTLTCRTGALVVRALAGVPRA